LFALVLLLFAANLSNLPFWRRLEDHAEASGQPQVSILVPARNEETNIERCVRSLLAQDYPAYELLVLDDHSTDRTGEILRALAAENPKLRVLQGTPLPAGWMGKTWACQQLADHAQGELLLFTDADTRHHPQCLRDAVATLQAEDLGYLSVMPKEEVLSWGERLLLPIISCVTYSFAPLFLAYCLRSPRWTFSNGQFILMRRSAFQTAGGYRTIHDNVADDVAIARRIKECGFRWRFLDGTRRVHCRMYTGFRQTCEGFSKNLFAVFDYRIAPFLLLWLFLLYLAWQPLVVLALALFGVPLPDLLAPLALAHTALGLIMMSVAHYQLGFPVYLAMLYPVTLLLAFGVALYSMIVTIRGRATWKDRTLARPRVTWF
jgi:chlorobactene glucosyltransferase